MKEGLYNAYFCFREYYDSIPQKGGRPTWDDVGMALAFDLTPRVVCKHHIAGCCVLDENHSVVAMGYNGPVRGDVHCREVGCAKKDGVFCDIESRKVRTLRCRGMHGEINAILNSYVPNRLKGATIYITLEPCFDCFKAIVQAGIVRVVYGEPYVRVADKDTHTDEHDSVVYLAKSRGIELVEFKIPKKRS